MMLRRGIQEGGWRVDGGHVRLKSVILGGHFSLLVSVLFELVLVTIVQ